MANKKASFKNDVVVIRKAMSDTITSRYGALRDALESLMESFAAHLLEDELIDKDVAEKQIYHHIMGQFLSGMDTKDSIPDLEEHCQIFADVLKELGEATNKIASELNNEWNAIIKQQPLSKPSKTEVQADDTKAIEEEEQTEYWTKQGEQASSHDKEVHVVIGSGIHYSLTTSLPNNPAQLDDDQSIKKVTVTPTWLSKKICKQSHTVSVLPALLMSGGLPNSGKSEAIQLLMKLTSIPPPGFSHYESIATGLTSNSPIQAQRVDDDHLYYYGFYSGFRKILAIGSKWAHDFRLDAEQENKFKNSKLQQHLFNIMECLKKTMQPTGSIGLKKMKNIMKGTGLIKVWDLTFNSITLQFLNKFSGHLYNSYMWLFIDIERDRPQLHRPISPEEGNTNMRRSRLEYLVRSSRLSSCFEKERRDTSLIFAMHSDIRPKSQGDQRRGQKQKQKSQSDQLTKLQRECLYIAPQLGVQSLINENITPINFTKTKRSYLLNCLKQQITRPHNESNDIPLSYIFLRGALDLEESIFLTHDQIKNMAMECDIGEESFKEFCRFFTSFGSILDVSFINPCCKVVIIKPNKFLATLSKAFNPNEIRKEKSALQMDGIITEELAHTLFGEEKDMFLKVLEATDLIANVTDRCLKYTGHCYYMPSVRQSKEQLHYNQKAIHLVRSVCYPSVNMEVALSKYLLGKIPEVMIEPSEMDNITCIRFIHNNINGLIKIVYQGDVIEFVIESEDSDIFLHFVNSIIDGCREIAEQNGNQLRKPNYHFGILCTKDNLQFAYNISRKRHILPVEELCDHCVENTSLTKIWNEALRKSPIPNELQLTGDLKPEDVQLLATQISRYSDDAVKAFKSKLEDPQDQLSLPQDKAKWWYYLMTMITKWMTEHSHTKKIMANKLIELHAIFKDTRGIRFRELAKRIDFQVRTDTQLEYLQVKKLERQDSQNTSFTGASPLLKHLWLPHKEEEEKSRSAPSSPSNRH